MLKKLGVVLLAMVLVLGAGAQDVRSDQSASVIVNLMLKKGLITSEEAVEVLAELEALEEAPTGTEIDKKLAMLPKKGIVVGAKQGKKINVSGRVQADARFGDKVLRTSDTFDIRRARIAVSGRIVDDLKYKVQIDAADNSDILRDAKITYDRFDEVNATVGQFKIPFGQEELTSSTKIHTIERSNVTSAIAPSRDRGAMLHGKLFDGFLAYSGGVFNGNGINSSNDNDDYLYGGRVVLTPVKTEIAGKKTKIQIGGSIAYSEDSDAGLKNLGFSDFVGDREIYGLDGKVTWGPLTLRGEYLKADLEFDGIAPTMTSMGDPARDSDADGYYLIGSYFFHPKWEAVAKWEELEGDDIKDFDALTLGLNYYFKEWTNKKLMPTRLMVNYIHGDLEGSSEEDQVILRLQVGF